MTYTRPRGHVASYEAIYFKRKGKTRVEIKESNWAVGYTPANKATPREALEYLLEKLKEEQAHISMAKEITEAYIETIALNEFCQDEEEENGQI